MLKKVFYILLVLISLSLYSNSTEKLLVALDKLDYDDNLFQFYTKSTSINEDGRVEREVFFNPLSTPNETLLRVDGRKPTDKEIKEFNKRRGDEGEGDGGSDFEELLSDDYTLLKESDTTALFSFNTVMDSMPGITLNLYGEIEVDLLDSVINSIHIKNSEEFKSILGRVNIMEMDFRFEKYNSEISVLKNMKFKVAGKMLFNKFSEESEIKLYNYQMVN